MMNIAPSSIADLSLDGHLDADRLRAKIEAGRVMHAESEGRVVGMLRHGFFWDEIPFMNLVRVAPSHQRQGIGRALVESWEQGMRGLGYSHVLTSTQADEDAQHFYRRLGYTDIGGFVIPAEPLEIVLYKKLGSEASS